jgi:hypothetical protein
MMQNYPYGFHFSADGSTSVIGDIELRVSLYEIQETAKRMMNQLDRIDVDMKRVDAEKRLQQRQILINCDLFRVLFL